MSKINNVLLSSNHLLSLGLIFVLAIISILFLSGCAQQLTPESEASGDSASKPLIVATFNPLGDIATAVAGNLATVELLVPSSSEPHDFDPSPQDIRKLSQSDIVVANGAGLEPWLPELLLAAKNSNVSIISIDTNISLIAHGEDEEHTADEVIVDGVDNEHHEQSGIDPHVWLVPRNLIDPTQRLANELTLIDQIHSANYLKNADDYIQNLSALDQQLATLFEHCDSRKFIILHGFLGYFCQAYGCEQVGVQGLSPETDITPKQLALAIETARSQNITVIVVESMASDKTEQSIADAIGGEVISISPYERKSTGDLNGYIETMQSNAQAFKSALHCD